MKFDVTLKSDVTLICLVSPFLLSFRCITLFEGETKDFDDKQNSKNHYKIIKTSNNNKEIDWKLFWTKYYKSCPQLSIIALSLLSIGISEACVERSFSIQKLTHSDIRNRMKEDIVEAEMRLRFNKHVMSDEYSDEILKNQISNDDDDELSDVEDTQIIDLDQNDVAIHN